MLEPDDESPYRRRSLMEYLDTLRRFTALDPGVAPGGRPGRSARGDLLAAEGARPAG